MVKVEISGEPELRAAELRVGSWYVIEGVAQIWTLEDFKTINDEQERCGQGVPLYRVYLERFGAVYQYGSTYFLGKLRFDFSSEGVCRFHWSGKVTYLDFVHELQDLYRGLMKTELIIDSEAIK